MEDPDQESHLLEAGENAVSVDSIAPETVMEEVVFNEPINLDDYDENDISVVLQRRLSLKDSSPTKAPPQDVKKEQKEMLKSLEATLNFQEDEEEILRYEELRKKLMEEKMKAALMDNDGEEEDEKDDDDNDNAEKSTETAAAKASSSAAISTATPKSGSIKWVEVGKLKQSIYEALRPNMAITYPFELDEFQKQAVMRLERKEHVFVAAHTSAGKTVVAEYGIALALKNKSRAIYTSPIKALSNQKFRDFQDKFGAENVGIVTGDVSVNPQAQCLIVTTEIFRSMLYKGADTVRDIEYVIFDEVHYVNDAERGVVWEEVIIMLPSAVSLIFLSATSPNAPEFSEWIGRTKRRKVHLISTDKRPVPLQHYLYHDQEVYLLLGGSSSNGKGQGSGGGGYQANAVTAAINRVKDKAKPKAPSAENAKMAMDRQNEKAALAAQAMGRPAPAAASGRGGGNNGRGGSSGGGRGNSNLNAGRGRGQGRNNGRGGSGSGGGGGSNNPPGGGKAQWLQLIQLLAAGGREATGSLSAVDFGVAKASHVLTPAARAEKNQRVPYEKLPAELRAIQTKAQYEREEFLDENDVAAEEQQKGLLPVVVFQFSKKRCEEIADYLKGQDYLTNREKNRVLTQFASVLQRLTPADAELPQILRLKELLQRGIGIHHGGLLPLLKETVEILFSNNLVKVLLATETFAMGVNMPARTTVFGNIKKHDGREYRELTPGEYIQMAGRAGRRGLDPFGTVIITAFNDIPPEPVFKKLLTGRPTVLQSKFRLRYNMILNLLRVENLSVADMIKQSFTEFAAQKQLAQHDLLSKQVRYQQYLAHLTSTPMSFEEEDELFHGNEDEKEALQVRIKQRQRQFAEAQLLIQEQSSFLLRRKKVDLHQRLLCQGRVLRVSHVAITMCPVLAVVLLDPAQTVTTARSAAAASTAASANTNAAAAAAKTTAVKSAETTAADRLAAIKAKLSVGNTVQPNAAAAPPTVAALTAVTSAGQNNGAWGNASLPLGYDEKSCSVWALLYLPHGLLPSVEDMPELTPFTAESPFSMRAPHVGWMRDEQDRLFLVAKVNLSSIGQIYNSIVPISSSADAASELSTSSLTMLSSSLAALHGVPQEVKDIKKEEKVFDVDFTNRQVQLATYDREFCRDEAVFLSLGTLYPRWYVRQERIARIQKKVDLISTCVSDESLSLFPDFKQRIGLLSLLGYLHVDTQTVTTKGRVCCEMNACDELLGTEMLFHNILEPLNPPEAAAILSALVFQEKNEEDNERLTSRMEVARTSLQALYDQLTKLQEVERIENDTESKPSLNFGLCTVVYQWARGMAFKDIMAMTPFQEGSIVRAITRLDELCRDVQGAAKVMGNPSLYNKMEAASQCIKRDIVFAASLYISLEN